MLMVLSQEETKSHVVKYPKLNITDVFLSIIQNQNNG